MLNATDAWPVKMKLRVKVVDVAMIRQVTIFARLRIFVDIIGSLW